MCIRFVYISLTVFIISFSTLITCIALQVNGIKINGESNYTPVYVFMGMFAFSSFGWTILSFKWCNPRESSTIAPRPNEAPAPIIINVSPRIVLPIIPTNKCELDIDNNLHGSGIALGKCDTDGIVVIINP